MNVKKKIVKKWLVIKNDHDEQQQLSCKRIFKKAAKEAENSIMMWNLF